MYLRYDYVLDIWNISFEKLGIIVAGLKCILFVLDCKITNINLDLEI